MPTTKLFTCAALTGLLASLGAAPATQPKSADRATNPYVSPDDDTHLDAEYEAAFTAVEDSLQRCPPQLKVLPERRDALTLLDVILHDPFAPQRKPVQDFHLHQAEATAAALEHDAPPAQGANVYMFYNMGFVVRTHTVTVAFDLIRMKHLEPFALPDELMDRIVKQCDVMFISHVHLDHADPAVAAMFLDQGKPVVAPADMWTDQPIHTRLTSFARDESVKQTLTLQGGKQSIGVMTEPGIQAIKTGENVTNNVYVIRTPEDILISQTGDNNTYRPRGLTWPGPDGKPQRIDILLMNDWTVIQAPRTLRGYDPRLVIAGHFDELGHDNVAARAPFWRGLVHGEKSVYPWLVMTWGEQFHYDRDAMPPSPVAKR